MRVDFIVFNINKMEIEKEGHIESNKFFKGEFDLITNFNKNNKFLSLAGIKINDLKFRVNNAPKFINYIILRCFEGYEMINIERRDVGHPDYVLKKGNDKIYLELKVGEVSCTFSSFFINLSINYARKWGNMKDKGGSCHGNEKEKD